MTKKTPHEEGLLIFYIVLKRYDRIAPIPRAIGISVFVPPISARCKTTAALINDVIKTIPYNEVIGIASKITPKSSPTPVVTLYLSNFM